MPAKKHPSSAGSEAKKIDDLALSRKDGDYKLRGSAVAVVAVLALGLTAFIVWIEKENSSRQYEQMQDGIRRLEEKQNAVAEVRIEQCHSIQRQALVVMESVADAYKGQARLVPLIEDFTRRMEHHMIEQTALMHDIRKGL